jgi:site-specific recombinase XerD
VPAPVPRSTAPDGSGTRAQFTLPNGERLTYHDVTYNGLRVAALAASESTEVGDVMWAGLHTFASRMLAAGRNIKEAQMWLGHHKASFTLDTYQHLMNGDLGAPLAPRDEPGGQRGAKTAPETAANDLIAGNAENG